jgi:hypothetical protein
MNIVSIFSGREGNINILKKYLEKAMELGFIDEVHFWNNTRNKSDENYIKSISNLKRTSSHREGNYILINPEISNNSFELNIRASNDIHIKIQDDSEYEIVLGGWANTRSVIRQNGKELACLVQNNVADKDNYNNFKVICDNDSLEIKKNNESLLSCQIKSNFDIKEIYFKTGFKSVGDISYNAVKNHGFYFMDTCERSWKNYYTYYNDKKYVDDIIIKCDDDIVFIDIYKLPKFIEYIKNTDNDIVFANTINNGVAAYYQQHKYELIPKTLLNLEYPPGGLCGSLWESGKKAEELHKYFIENYTNFINKDYNNEILPIDTRFSINFFGFPGKKWNKIVNCFKDDEYNLTVEYVKNNGFKNVLYADLYVSHLSFYRQIETGINIIDLQDKYNKLYCTFFNKNT